MGIVADLTPTQYKPIRLVIEIKPDETLTIDSITLHSDMDILNEYGHTLGRDHPTPQATSPQLTAFLNWVISNLTTYETLTGLTRYTEE